VFESYDKEVGVGTPGKSPGDKMKRGKAVAKKRGEGAKGKIRADVDESIASSAADGDSDEHSLSLSASGGEGGEGEGGKPAAGGVSVGRSTGGYFDATAKSSLFGTKVTLPGDTVRGVEGADDEEGTEPSFGSSRIPLPENVDDLSMVGVQNLFRRQLDIVRKSVAAARAQYASARGPEAWGEERAEAWGDERAEKKGGKKGRGGGGKKGWGAKGGKRKTLKYVPTRAGGSGGRVRRVWGGGHMHLAGTSASERALGVACEGFYGRGVSPQQPPSEADGQPAFAADGYILRPTTPSFAR
jgi:hypothetical protein